MVWLKQRTDTLAETDDVGIIARKARGAVSVAVNLDDIDCTDFAGLRTEGVKL